MPLRCLQGVDLPTGSLRARFQHPIKIIRSMLRGWIWTDMTGSETILNSQQIHTFPSITTMIVSVYSMVVDRREAVCSLRTE